MKELIAKTIKGDSIAMARLISLIENEDPHAVEILKTLYPSRKNSFRVGVTGPPGVGKSTLVDRLALHARTHHDKVGIVCVDPTSPFTGGAILGDRIRMSKAAEDPDIYIRSMATRGSQGGIARTTEEVAEVLEASGKNLIFIETVGVGQSELDIFNAVDTVVVVLVPESGTGVQAMKAGLMEIAHLFVVNKADRPGANRMKQDIEDVLSFSPPKDWEVKVILTQAYRDIGTDLVFSRILEHKKFLQTHAKGSNSRLTRIQKKLMTLLHEKIEKKILEPNGAKNLLQKLSEGILSGKVDPYTAAENFLEKSLNPWQKK